MLYFNISWRLSAYKTSILPNICFPNIRYLTLSLVFDNCYWYLLPTLNRLISLDISFETADDKVQSQLQMLLDRAPHRYSLKLTRSTNSTLVLSRLISSSVRRLEIDAKTDNSKIHTPWLRSKLGIQCEMLHIKVKRSSDVINIVNKLNNLRSIHAICSDTSIISMDTFIEQLNRQTNRYASTSIVITNEDDSTNIYRSVQIWIR
jgi:hypothetical protein